MDPTSNTAGLSLPANSPSDVQVAQYSQTKMPSPSQQQDQSSNAPGFNAAYSLPQHLQQLQNRPQLQWAQHAQPQTQSQSQFVQQTQPQNPDESIITGWAKSTEEWLRKFWKRCAALLVMIGSILAIYYQVRADRRDERNLDYAQRSWKLAAWTAHKDYCEYQLSQDKDFDTDACLVTAPPHEFMRLKRWVYGHPTVWNTKQWMLGLAAFLTIGIGLKMCISAIRSSRPRPKPQLETPPECVVETDAHKHDGTLEEHPSCCEVYGHPSTSWDLDLEKSYTNSLGDISFGLSRRPDADFFGDTTVDFSYGYDANFSGGLPFDSSYGFVPCSNTPPTLNESGTYLDATEPPLMAHCSSLRSEQLHADVTSFSERMMPLLAWNGSSEGPWDGKNLRRRGRFVREVTKDAATSTLDPAPVHTPAGIHTADSKLSA